MSLTSPLRRVLGLGAAKEGVSHWWSQRVTAVALVVLTLWLAASLLTLGNFSHATVLTFVGKPFNAVLLSLLLIAGAWHSQLGVQVVIEDYVSHPWVKVVSLLLLDFLHFALGAAGVFAVLRIALA